MPRFLCVSVILLMVGCRTANVSSYETRASSSDTGVRVLLARELGDPPYTEPKLGILGSLLSDESMSVRLAAALSAEKTGSPALCPHLLPLLWENNPSMNAAGVLALDSIGVKHEMPALIDAIEKHQDNSLAIVPLFYELCRITGNRVRDTEFDFDDEKEKKALVIRKWREWWRISRDIDRSKWRFDLFAITPEELRQAASDFEGKDNLFAACVFKLTSDDLDDRILAISLLFALSDGETFDYNPYAGEASWKKSAADWRMWFDSTTDK